MKRKVLPATHPGAHQKPATALLSRKRPPIERMQRILAMLQEGNYPNCSRIAVELEVGTKSIWRDIEFMRDRMNLPIEYDQQHHGYFLTGPVEFPGIQVTEAELFALVVAYKAIDQYRGTPFQQPLKAAFEKITSQLDSQHRYSIGNWSDLLSFRPFAPEETDLDAFRLVTRAIAERRALTFDYRKPAQKQAQPKRLHPYHLTCSDNRWYLIGLDVNIDDVHTFAVGRMANLTITAERFPKPVNFNLGKYLQGAFSIMKGQGRHEVVIEFDAWATDILRGRKWHPSEKITNFPDGSSRMQLLLGGLEEVERWILSWGIHATVLQPESLAARIRHVSTQVASKYAQSKVVVSGQ